MFLFMHCNNHCPVNLKEQRLFELIVPTCDKYIDLARAKSEAPINKFII